MIFCFFTDNNSEYIYTTKLDLKKLHKTRLPKIFHNIFWKYQRNNQKNLMNMQFWK